MTRIDLYMTCHMTLWTCGGIHCHCLKKNISVIFHNYINLIKISLYCTYILIKVKYILIFFILIWVPYLNKYNILLYKIRDKIYLE